MKANSTRLLFLSAAVGLDPLYNSSSRLLARKLKDFRKLSIRASVLLPVVVYLVFFCKGISADLLFHGVTSLYLGDIPHILISSSIHLSRVPLLEIELRKIEATCMQSFLPYSPGL